MEISGTTILQYRKKHGITQDEFAKQIGVSIRTIQNYENGAKIPESKKVLFKSLMKLEIDEETIAHAAHDDELLKKFEHISINEVCAYIIMKENKFMGNKLFQLIVNKIANERALDIVKGL